MAHKRKEVARQMQAVPLAEIKTLGSDRSTPIDFSEALGNPGVSLIAEVKLASPSKGAFHSNLSPVQLAQNYAANGATAISVLTDSKFFQGSLQYLADIKSALDRSQYARPSTGQSIPILRKDFIFDPYQVYESRAYGADGLLLIVAVLSDQLLSELLALTHDLDMTALVEVHDEQELQRALRLHPKVVGINNRNLHDFSVDLRAFASLRPFIPENVIVVAESGVHGADDVRQLGAMGADAVLVGEALVTAHDLTSKIRELAEAGQAEKASHKSEQEIS